MGTGGKAIKDLQQFGSYLFENLHPHKQVQDTKGLNLTTYAFKSYKQKLYIEDTMPEFREQD